MKVKKIFFAGILAAVVQPVWSCSVCFGEAGSALSKGFFWGILLLLLLPAVLAGLIGYKIFIAERNKQNQNSH